MQKAKFQIKGMNCKSCAVLIEEKLKKPGIIKTKVDYDSQKAVVVYDEQKIQEDKIIQTIKEVDDYQIDKIEEEPQKEENAEENGKQETEKKDPALSKILISLKVLIGIAIFSVILNFFLFNSFSKQLSLSGKEGTAAVAESLPSQQIPSNQQLPFNLAPAIQTFEITKDNHIRGDFNAPITLVEFSDFECPFCERHYPTLNKILNDYSGKVRLVYKHFPLGFHPNGQKAAEASECASEQGKFWEYHDKLFANLQTTGYSVENFKKWMQELGLDTAKFNSCLDSDKYAQKVKNDYQEGLQKGVNGTPATFVNGELVSGAVPYDSFKQIIDGLLSS